MPNEKYALISVYNKRNIADFAEKLHSLGYKIISTGGSAKVLSENRIPVIPIEQITGNPESFDGRMKTISFQIESGILYERNNPNHVKEAKKLNVLQIDIVVCNLYPFEDTVARAGATEKEAIENIDIGGPTMIRAAAKNYTSVTVVVDPDDYEMIISLLSEGKLDEKSRRTLSQKAFAHTAFYDAQIAGYFQKDLFPNELTLPLRKETELRYGENPHQQAALYFYPQTNSPLKNLQKLWGRELSHLNITDINAGLESVRLFTQPCSVIIKHNCPCGIALGKSADEALSLAIEADPESAFGGIVVSNTPMTLQAAKEIGKFKHETKANIDIVAVPEIDKQALDFLKTVRKSMGIYTFGNILKKGGDLYNIKSIDGGMVLQTPDVYDEAIDKNWKVVTKKKQSAKQLAQMIVAWKFISRIKSNAVVVIDKDLPMTRGIGTGQTSRVRSTKIALSQAGKKTHGAILASDGFFPFEDSVRLAAKAGIETIIQPGGSINDQASINEADKAGMVMVFTNRRAFWH